MAITKLISPSTPNPLPPAGAGGDWDKAMAQLTAVKKLLSGEQMILTQWTNNTTAPALAKGSYFQHMGAIYVVDTEDYVLPALSADGTYYIRVAVSGETLSVSYSVNIADYSWSAQHNGLYHADESQVLPYQVIKAGASIGKYKILNPWQASADFAVVDYLGHLHGTSLGISGAASIGGNATVGGTLGVTGAISGASVGVTGAISGASINTGLGDFEIGQDLRVTDSPRFYSRKIGTTIKTQATLTRGMWWTLLQAFIPAGAEVALYGAYYSTYHSQLIVVSSALKNASTGAIVIYGIATSGDFGQRISTCVEGDAENMSSSCSISL